MKRYILALLFCAFAWGGTCEAVTLRFTNAEINLGNGSPIQMTNEYAAYGLQFQNVYRYVDSRDPFSDAPNQVDGANLGIANGFDVAVGRVDFVTPTDASGITFDWWTLPNLAFQVEAFNSAGVQIGSFSSPAAPNPSGTNTILGSIKYFTFHNGAASVAIANLTYNLVPEPTALLLAMIGVGALVRVRGQRN